ncbi:hypothetical protein PHAVU_005G110600 [Phaseolus vulgaris]|uniref:B box-type domain-containing protein n=1 Tax=Phaseolus vulgaris TaxID=3885 RepID=V7BXX7_PHAVU|nr:hypothetical protein PHAVU_005G110600g [Phaseolus vulgaris]ESW21918.1 hypothetical protein PHAVU_005G110600g [Phaseolus vulgaris]
MKNCELCKVPARTFCESDQASLCWDCDAKVHGANFLVARHTRTLLCHTCQSLTPWKASGAALGNTVSLCERCAGGTAEQGQESHGGNDDDIDTDEDDYDDDDETDDEVAADEDGDNQVVPWSSAPPPPPSSSSSSEESVSRCNNADEDVSTTFKRRREDNDFECSNSNNWGCQQSDVEREGWLVRLRRRTAAKGNGLAVERRSGRAVAPYGCDDDDRASEDL